MQPSAGPDFYPNRPLLSRPGWTAPPDGSSPSGGARTFHLNGSKSIQPVSGFQPLVRRIPGETFRETYFFGFAIRFTIKMPVLFRPHPAGKVLAPLAGAVAPGHSILCEAGYRPLALPRYEALLLRLHDQIHQLVGYVDGPRECSIPRGPHFT